MQNKNEFFNDNQEQSAHVFNALDAQKRLMAQKLEEEMNKDAVCQIIRAINTNPEKRQCKNCEKCKCNK